MLLMEMTKIQDLSKNPEKKDGLQNENLRKKGKQ
jgi:hypothetical protein